MYTIWKVPKIQTKGFESIPDDEKFKLENEARRTLIQLFGGIFFLGTLFFSWNSYKLSKKEEMSKRFSETISLFGNDKIDARIEAIYSLENLANDYKDERETIYQILLSYVKEKAGSSNIKDDTFWLSEDYYDPCSSDALFEYYSPRKDSVLRVSLDIQAE